MATVSEFYARFPEFACKSADRVQMFLDDATLIMGSESRWLDFYKVANLYLAAHLLYLAEAVLSGDGSAMYPLKKQEVDDVIVEQAIANREIRPEIEDFYSTMYGKNYVRYRRICFTGMYGV